MKRTSISRLLSIVIVFFITESKAQSNALDSMKTKILKMDLAINNMHNNMVKSHKEFKTGVVISLAGAILTSFVAAQDWPKGNHGPLMAIGGTVSFVGTILIIDSHKYIGYGGRRGKGKT